MIGGRDRSLLAQVARELDADPEVNIVRMMGDGRNPSLIVAEMSPAHAQALQERFAPHLMIEPDSPLSPLDSIRNRSNVEVDDVMVDKEKGENDQPRRSRSQKNSKSRPEAEPGGAGAPRKRPAPATVESRPQRYMLAAKSPLELMSAGMREQAISPAALHQILDEDPRVEVVRRLAPARATLFSTDVSVPEIVVAEMDADYARTLREQLPQVQIERDRLLTHGASVPPIEQVRDEPLLTPLGLQTPISFLVQDADAAPLPDVTIHVLGATGRFQAVTGRDGRAQMTLFGDTPKTVQTVLVLPAQGHWNWRMDRPQLSPTSDNVITLKRLSDTFSGFPGQQMFGWGQRAMRMEQLSPTFRGAGVRVAVIDSGADIQHPDLKNQVTSGKDLVDRTANGWTVDTVRHGSHCSGVIAAADNGQGLFGFAPEADIHVCKIFPGGWESDLVAALDYCIEKEIDVVNLSMGMPGYNNIIAQKINDARALGVACIVAAGNTAGPVNFPGNLPTVLTVAALGKLGTYPPDSAHAAEALQANSDGYFSARFTCLGPEVDVCAPGVAVLSTVPGGGYAAWDGTSQAAPHVTGLAALILAHRDEFHNEFRPRDSRRVDRLFQIITSSCTPVELGDRNRTGAGMPDAPKAFEPAAVPSAPSRQAELEQLIKMLLQAGLIPAPGVSPQHHLVPAEASPSAAPPAAALGSAAEAPTATGVQGALARLDREMYAAGLSGYGPDPLL